LAKLTSLSTPCSSTLLIFCGATSEVVVGVTVGFVFSSIIVSAVGWSLGVC